MKNRAINNWKPMLNKDAKKAAVVKRMKEVYTSGVLYS